MEWKGILYSEYYTQWKSNWSIGSEVKYKDWETKIQTTLSKGWSMLRVKWGSPDQW